MLCPDRKVWKAIDAAGWILFAACNLYWSADEGLRELYMNNVHGDGTRGIKLCICSMLRGVQALRRQGPTALRFTYRAFMVPSYTFKNRMLYMFGIQENRGFTSVSANSSRVPNCTPSAISRGSGMVEPRYIPNSDR